jgi:hypothetical protein
VPLRKAVMRKRLVLGLAAVVDEELRHDTSPKVVAPSQRLIVHLVRRNRYREVILLQ